MTKQERRAIHTLLGGLRRDVIPFLKGEYETYRDCDWANPCSSCGMCPGVPESRWAYNTLSNTIDTLERLAEGK